MKILKYKSNFLQEIINDTINFVNNVILKWLK